MSNKTAELKIGVAGIRGIVPDSLTPEIVVQFARAFGQYLGGGPVVLGRDTRPSGLSLQYQIASGLLTSGISLIQLGICATPTVQIFVREKEAAGGVMITASHNPLPWNGLKFISRAGLCLNNYQGQALLAQYVQEQRGIAKFNMGKTGELIVEEDAFKVHLQKILAGVDQAKIRAKKFRVVLDSGGGAGYEGGQRLLKELGCAIVDSGLNSPGQLRPDPEPRPENLRETIAVMKQAGAVVGFAQDPDADRLALIDEQGNALSEELTLALATDFYLEKQPGLVVTNLSSSRLLDDVAARHGCQVLRTKVGEVNVGEAMQNSKAVIGGEGNGGVIVPAVGWGRDSFVGMAVILEALANKNITLSQWVAQLPQYHMLKTKITCPSIEKVSLVVEELARLYKGKDLNREDGVKLSEPDHWWHVRGSNTEPILRLIVEASGQAKAEAVAGQLRGQVQEILQKI